LGPVNVRDFLKTRLSVKKGPVLNSKGEVIGEHEGVWFYTEGQRHGFRIFRSGLPLYVIAKDQKRNALIVGRGEEAKVASFRLEDLHLLYPSYYEILISTKDLRVRIRHLGELLPACAGGPAHVASPARKDASVSGRQSAAGGSVKIAPPRRVSARGGRNLNVVLDEPALSLAPGQSAVFYRPTGPAGRDFEVLGGGIVTKTQHPVTRS
jgi:tRNA-specific 2-thiouridylase